MKDRSSSMCGVVVLYNPPDNVVDNIATYIDQVHKLFIVDNSENNEEISPVNCYRNNRKVDIIRNKSNLGIAKALNIGALKGLNEGYEYILTMDQDSRLSENTTQNLIYYTEKNGYNLGKVGIMAPFPYDKANPRVPDEEVQEQLCVLTSGNLVNLRAYMAAGGFDEELFIDKVDDEFCLRMHLHNYSVLRVNAVIMNHNLGDITHHRLLWRPQIVTNHSALRRYYITRNSCYVVAKYKKKFPQYRKEQLWAFFFEISKIILFEQKRLKKIKAIMLGYFDYKKGRFGKYESNHLKKI